MPTFTKIYQPSQSLKAIGHQKKNVLAATEIVLFDPFYLWFWPLPNLVKFTRIYTFCENFLKIFQSVWTISSWNNRLIWEFGCQSSVHWITVGRFASVGMDIQYGMQSIPKGDIFLLIISLAWTGYRLFYLEMYNLYDYRTCPRYI